ncbi:unnamed protein product [Ectocarpus sp. CCAP 1310/34]|nr:unnamed protein product [Ectocarpus sp. CCAP 1310/34]
MSLARIHGEEDVLLVSRTVLLPQSKRNTARRRGQGRPICQEPGCTTIPTFGKKGSKKPEFCLPHAKPNMVDVHNKVCDQPGCPTHPTFGKDDTRKAEFYGAHRMQGMVSVVGKKCNPPGCLKFPSYGKHGSNVRTRCGHPGCTKNTPFGVDGRTRTKAEFCQKHTRGRKVNTRLPWRPES